MDASTVIDLAEGLKQLGTPAKLALDLARRALASRPDAKVAELLAELRREDLFKALVAEAVALPQEQLHEHMDQILTMVLRVLKRLDERGEGARSTGPIYIAGGTTLRTGDVNAGTGSSGPIIIKTGDINTSK